MKFSTATILVASLASASAFAPSTFSPRVQSSLNIVAEDVPVAEALDSIFAGAPDFDEEFDETVQKFFPGAVDNKALVTNAVNHLSGKGYSGSNTLLATSLCCDELARQLEDDFNGVYGNNFNLGGLAGFPFAGNTGFGAMSAHIPDDGYCLIVYGPHVGVAADGTVGKVERSGISLIDNCCGSAIAASNYVQGITDGGAVITTKLQEFTDFQQGAVQELILPHGKRLADAENRMVELPYALFDSQDLLLNEIVKKGSLGIKRGVALLGGIQINTGPDTLDYFHPLKFDFMNYRGDVTDNMLDAVSRVSPPSITDDDAEVEVSESTPSPPVDDDDTVAETNISPEIVEEEVETVDEPELVSTPTDEEIMIDESTSESATVLIQEESTEVDDGPELASTSTDEDIQINETTDDSPTIIEEDTTNVNDESELASTSTDEDIKTDEPTGESPTVLEEETVKADDEPELASTSTDEDIKTDEPGPKPEVESSTRSIESPLSTEIETETETSTPSSPPTSPSLSVSSNNDTDKNNDNSNNNKKTDTKQEESPNLLMKLIEGAFFVKNKLTNKDENSS